MKPLDFGGGGVTGSVTAEGRIIALNFYHPQHGYVTLTSAEPFPERERYNPPAVRAYRAGLTQLDGFGCRFDAPITARSAHLIESAIPKIDLEFAGNTASVVTVAYAQGAVQHITAPGQHLRWGGRLCLQRCAYSQLTEGGPLPAPPLRMAITRHDGLLIIHNPELGAAVAVGGLDGTHDTLYADHPVEIELGVTLAAPITLVYGVGLTVDEAAANARWLGKNTALDDVTAKWRGVWRGLPDDPLVRRGIAYGLMLGVPVGGGLCILTDHMLLPLSWNRDAYFVARALLSAGQPDAVRRHLLWTFETAVRPAGYWARCYLASGQVKDPAFQLDQQLYPLLELAEYVRETGDRVTLERLRPHVEPILHMLDRRRTSNALLYATDETPGDDPIALPYHLSSHILMWHTLRALSAITDRWHGRTAPLRETIQRTFTAEHGGERLYAYATDGAGGYHLYHDANDLPLALAPAWGFVAADDPTWRATVTFAFSEANRGGFYAGQLGSVHTPAPWALGDVQDAIIARALGDSAREAAAYARLHNTAQLDGALPEAYDAASGAVVSRHWFAWANAAFACLELGALNG